MTRISSGFLKGRKINVKYKERPKPTTSFLKEALFNILGEKNRGSDILDCFAGTGSIGFEAFSRGANSVVFIEQDRQLIESLRQNITDFKVRGEVYSGNYFINLINLRRKHRVFDWIYLYPPYFSKQLTTSFEGCLKNKLLKSDGLIITERYNKSTDISKDLLKKYGVSHIDSREYGMAALDFYKLL